MSGSSSARAWSLIGVALGALCFYALGLNPWIAPGHYDALLYHEAANELARGNGFVYAGRLIRDWPPLFPLGLSLLRWFGDAPLWGDKVFVLLTVPCAVFLLHRLLLREARSPALAICVVFVLLPTALRYGTSPMAEWPYLLASFAFLSELNGLVKKRHLGRAVLLGACLGLCSLVRYTGVFLGAAVVAQGFQAWRRARAPGVNVVLPEAVCAFVGGATFLGWQVFLALNGHEATDIGNLSSESYSSFHPFAVLRAVGNLLVASDGLRDLFALPTIIAMLVWLIPAVLVLYGLFRRVFRRGWLASDAYTVAVLAFLCFYEQGEVTSHTRYLLPVAPFLVDALREGVEPLLARVRLPGKHAYVLSGWCLTLATADLRLLLHGTDAHAGLFFRLSANAQEFYRGEWGDLYSGAQTLRDEPRPGNVAIVGDKQGKFVRWFSGRDTVPFAQRQRAATFLLDLDGGADAPIGWRLRSNHGTVRVYELE